MHSARPPSWVILDRDGVINADRPDYVLTPQQWRPLPGSLAAIARLCAAGVRVAVATNQSAVGRGRLAPAGLARIHLAMIASVEAAGGRLEAVYTCPHAPDAACDCRKPAPGLLLRLAECLRFAPAQACVVGDQARDIEAARAAGMSAVAVGAAAAAGGYGAPTCADLARLVRHWLDGAS